MGERRGGRKRRRRAKPSQSKRLRQHKVDEEGILALAQGPALTDDIEQ